VQVGDAGDDVIVGGEQGDALLGKGGADIVLGNGGNDVGLGGSGSDTIEGGAGRDVILGGEGDDLIIGQTDDGADMIFGGAGSDTLDLSALTGGVTVDLGAYTPIGTVRAAGVTDHLIGVENVIGSTGADVIKASLGINVMTGGDGEDIFVFVSAGTANGDVITDFRPGDKIDLSGIDAMVGTNGNQSFTLSDVATTAAGNLVIREVATADGVDTIIDGFTDGDADADFSITLRGAHNLDTSSFNF
jgi:Ca2+-binding RTX toxin-like protein